MANENPAPRQTYKVPAQNIESLQERIAQVNKRVARLAKKGVEGVKPVTIEVGSMYAEKQVCQYCTVSGVPRHTCHHCNGTGLAGPDKVYADVTLLSPEPPKVNGWVFVAALTHVEGVGSVLRVVPGAEVAEGELAKYREAKPGCDHCKTDRRRNDTFILRKVG